MVTRYEYACVITVLKEQKSTFGICVIMRDSMFIQNEWCYNEKSM